MENISRAIIIAGGMILAILILSLLVFLFNKINILPEEQSQQLNELDIIEFNRSYEVYQKPLMYGTDIISIINKAVDHNMRNGLLNADSNFFSKSFVSPSHGELMSIEAKLKSNEEDLDLNTRVRIYYLEQDETGQIREKEYLKGRAIKGHENQKISKVLPDEKYKILLNSSGIDLYNKPFVSDEYTYDFKYGRGFLNINNKDIVLFAGDANQDVSANKSLMKFLEAESVTILNPDFNDRSWSRMVVTPASSKLKRLIFKADIDKTEYYQNGRIKKMYFEEIE